MLLVAGTFPDWLCFSDSMLLFGNWADLHFWLICRKEGNLWSQFSVENAEAVWILKLRCLLTLHSWIHFPTPELLSSQQVWWKERWLENVTVHIWYFRWHEVNSVHLFFFLWGRMEGFLLLQEQIYILHFISNTRQSTLCFFHPFPPQLGKEIGLRKGLGPIKWWCESCPILR